MKFDDYNKQEERKESLGRQPLEAIPKPLPPLLLGALDPREWTMLVADRGAGKTTLAAHWVSQLVREGFRVAVLDYEDSRAMWERLLLAFGTPDMLDDVMYYSPTLPLDEIASTLREEWQGKIDYCVIDSAALSVAGGVTEGRPESDPIRAKHAIARLEVPVLMLSHTTKSDRFSGEARAYGSTYWEALPRLVMTMVRFDKDNSIYKVTKASNYPSLMGKETKVRYDKDGDNILGLMMSPVVRHDVGAKF